MTLVWIATALVLVTCTMAVVVYAIVYGVESWQTEEDQTTGPTTVSTVSPAADGGLCDGPPPVLTSAGRHRRVVNGRDAGQGQHPWMVMVVVGGRFRCGGSVIAHRHVLTAAHCLRKPGTYSSGDTPVFHNASEVDVIAGKYTYVIKGTGDDVRGEQRASVSAVITHPGYNDTDIAKPHDLAVLELERDLQWTEWVRPVCLAARNASLPSVATVTGWGAVNPRRRIRWRGVKPTVLQELTVTVLTRENCIQRILPHFHYVTRMRQQQVCAVSPDRLKSRSTCNGDSGGPLTVRPRGGDVSLQYGVLSWGFCDSRLGVPSFFTFLPHYRHWIQKAMAPRQHQE